MLTNGFIKVSIDFPFFSVDFFFFANASKYGFITKCWLTSELEHRLGRPVAVLERFKSLSGAFYSREWFECVAGESTIF